MRRAALVLSVVLLSAAAHAAPGDTGAPSAPLTVGRTPPALSLARISGSEEVTLEGLHGRVVVLDFWATWCGPCRAVMPALDQLYAQHRGTGLSVLGLSSEPASLIRAHLSASPVGYTIARDTGGTVRRYGVRAIPMLVVLDRGGKVREVFVGVDGPAIARLDRLVAQLLAEPAP